MSKAHKSASYGFNAPHLHGYPANGYYYIICDVCGRKVRARDAVLINDKYNYLNGLLVCKDDADLTNPQTYIRSFRDRQVREPKLLRTEATDQFEYIDTTAQIEDGDTSDPATGDAPGAPTDLTVEPDSSTIVILRWRMDKTSVGSSNISGYKIERESPEGNGFSTVVSNTNSPALYYSDSGLSASTEYNYKVSAINSYGTSSASTTDKTTTPAS